MAKTEMRGRMKRTPGTKVNSRAAAQRMLASSEPSERRPRGDVGSPFNPQELMGKGDPRYNGGMNPAGLDSLPMRPNPFAVDSQMPGRPTPPIPTTGNPGGGITPETYIPDNLPDETIKIIMDLLRPEPQRPRFLG